MATIKPKKLTLRSYQVGFGDCFLLTFHYNGRTGDRHVLIDFGSTGKKKSHGENLMVRVAQDIKKRTDGKLHAIVATHRHKDHISGFTTNAKQTGPGDIIASCNPDVIIQPWTEHPKARVNAKQAPGTITKTQSFVSSLRSMHEIAESVLLEAERRKHILGKRLHDQLTFLGEDNLSNMSAVENLMRMGKRHHYLNYGARSGLESVLPGVKIRVLGPPNLKQSEEIKSQRSKDEDEFWQLQAMSNKFVIQKDPMLFNGARTYSHANAPGATRWFVQRVRALRGEQLLSIVRSLDKVMNNTSLILLFEVGGKKLLFPGDAQIENWSYALSKRSVQRLLAGVDLYKVGHHGSRNATPRSLWDNFSKRSDKETKNRLETFCSTMRNKHGTSRSKTEVPRKTLVAALKGWSNYHTTETLGKKLSFDFTMTFR